MSTKIIDATTNGSTSSNIDMKEDEIVVGDSNASNSNNGDEEKKRESSRLNVDADFDSFHKNAERIFDDDEEKQGTYTGEDKASTSNKTENMNDSKGNKDDDDEKGRKYVSPQDFELLRVIGIGSFGKVLQCRRKNKKEVVAMKVISKRLLQKKTSYVQNIHAERKILTKLSSHPFIVTMHCSFQTRDKLFIVMDYCAGGELFMWLGKNGVFLEKTASFYVAEIVIALEHLHSHNVLHRDLKPENILLNPDGHIRLTDFGLAKELLHHNNEDEKTLTVCGTQEYMAPEMIAKVGYGKAADFWSLGCIVYEMLAGNPPFAATKKGGAKELFQKIMVERVKMPKHSTANAHKVIKGLLNRNVTMRLGSTKSTMFQVGGITQLKQMEFFTNYWNWNKMEKLEHDPPEKFHVDHDEDYRHFHTEFTEMNLPRSVVLMSANNDKYKPRHCNSQTFRGFSFIQPDFEIPDRLQCQEQYYWDNKDEDGESLSDCASTIFQDDNNNIEANNNTADTINKIDEETPKKKKKKKKKKKQQSDENIDDNTNNGNHTKLADPPVAEDDMKLNAANADMEKITLDTSTKSHHTTTQLSETDSTKLKNNTDHDKKNDKKTNPWNKPLSKSLEKEKNTVQQLPKSTMAVSSSSTTGDKVGKSPLINNYQKSNKKPEWETVDSKSLKKQNNFNSSRPLPSSYKPPSTSPWNVVPNSNNSNMQKKSSPAWNNVNYQNQSSARITEPTSLTSTKSPNKSNDTTKSATSDWRTHSMHPQSKEPLWPSLSSPTPTRREIPKAAAPQATAPISRGAWASKVLNTSSTPSNQPKKNNKSAWNS